MIIPGFFLYRNKFAAVKRGLTGKTGQQCHVVKGLPGCTHVVISSRETFVGYFDWFPKAVPKQEYQR